METTFKIRYIPKRNTNTVMYRVTIEWGTVPKVASITANNVIPATNIKLIVIALDNASIKLLNLWGFFIFFHRLVLSHSAPRLLCFWMHNLFSLAK